MSSSSSSSQFQELSNQYNSLLAKYTTTYQNYINTINSNSNTFTSIPNASFVSGNNINVLDNSSVSNCQTSCSSIATCSGATLTESNNCILSEGNGQIVRTPQSTAIVKEVLYYSDLLQKLNAQMMDLNQQMVSLSNTSYNQFQQTEQKNQQQQQTLSANYKMLTKQREEIEAMIRQYGTIDTAYENGSDNVTANYYSYIVLMFVALFLVFALMRLNITGGGNQSGGGSGTKENYVKMALIAVIALLAFKYFSSHF